MAPSVTLGPPGATLEHEGTIAITVRDAQSGVRAVSVSAPGIPDWDSAGTPYRSTCTTVCQQTRTVRAQVANLHAGDNVIRISTTTARGDVTTVDRHVLVAGLPPAGAAAAAAPPAAAATANVSATAKAKLYGVSDQAWALVALPDPRHPELAGLQQYFEQLQGAPAAFAARLIVPWDVAQVGRPMRFTRTVTSHDWSSNDVLTAFVRVLTAHPALVPMLSFEHVRARGGHDETWYRAHCEPTWDATSKAQCALADPLPTAPQYIESVRAVLDHWFSTEPLRSRVCHGYLAPWNEPDWKTQPTTMWTTRPSYADGDRDLFAGAAGHWGALMAGWYTNALYDVMRSFCGSFDRTHITAGDFASHGDWSFADGWYVDYVNDLGADGLAAWPVYAMHDYRDVATGGTMSLDRFAAALPPTAKIWLTEQGELYSQNDRPSMALDANGDPAMRPTAFESFVAALCRSPTWRSRVVGFNYYHLVPGTPGWDSSLFKSGSNTPRIEASAYRSLVTGWPCPR